MVVGGGQHLRGVEAKRAGGWTGRRPYYMGIWRRVINGLACSPAPEEDGGRHPGADRHREDALGGGAFHPDAAPCDIWRRGASSSSWRHGQSVFHHGTRPARASAHGDPAADVVFRPQGGRVCTPPDPKSDPTAGEVDEPHLHRVSSRRLKVMDSTAIRCVWTTGFPSSCSILNEPGCLRSWSAEPPRGTLVRGGLIHLQTVVPQGRARDEAARGDLKNFNCVRTGRARCRWSEGIHARLSRHHDALNQSGQLGGAGATLITIQPWTPRRPGHLDRRS